MPYDDYADYASVGDTAQVMGEAILGIFQLSLVSLTLKLFVHLIYHANPGGADRMAETLQTPVGLTGLRPVEVETARHYIVHHLPSGAELQVLHGHCLGD